jgi:hypothetical protein
LEKGLFYDLQVFEGFNFKVFCFIAVTGFVDNVLSVSGGKIVARDSMTFPPSSVCTCEALIIGPEACLTF